MCLENCLQKNGKYRAMTGVPTMIRVNKLVKMMKRKEIMTIETEIT